MPTDVGQEIYATARALYEALGLDRARLRLVGVRIEGLVDAETSARAAAPRRTRARLAGGRAGCRPAAAAVRCRGGPPGSLVDAQHDPAQRDRGNR